MTITDEDAAEMRELLLGFKKTLDELREGCGQLSAVVNQHESVLRRHHLDIAHLTLAIRSMSGMLGVDPQEEKH